MRLFTHRANIKNTNDKNYYSSIGEYVDEFKLTIDELNLNPKSKDEATNGVPSPNES